MEQLEDKELLCLGMRGCPSKRSKFPSCFTLVGDKIFIDVHLLSLVCFLNWLGSIEVAVALFCCHLFLVGV